MTIDVDPGVRAQQGRVEAAARRLAEAAPRACAVVEGGAARLAEIALDGKRSPRTTQDGSRLAYLNQRERRHVDLVQRRVNFLAEREGGDYDRHERAALVWLLDRAGVNPRGG